MKHLLPILLILPSAQAAEIKPVPPLGVAVPAAVREAGLARLGHSIYKICSPPLAQEVIIFHKAMRYALLYDEFLEPENPQQSRIVEQRFLGGLSVGGNGGGNRSRVEDGEARLEHSPHLAAPRDSQEG